MTRFLRYATFLAVALATPLLLVLWHEGRASGWWAVLTGALAALGVVDLLQTRHAVLRNYPVLGHARFFFEMIRPEIRQYLIESDTDGVLAIGHPWEWFAIAKAMHETGITPDFIVVDGKAGGTGAAPAEFIDRVGTPMQEALMLVHNTLIGLGLRDRVHPGDELPYRPLSDRRHHAGPGASAGAGGARQGRACLQLPPEHAQGHGRAGGRSGSDPCVAAARPSHRAAGERPRDPAAVGDQAFGGADSTNAGRANSLIACFARLGWRSRQSIRGKRKSR